MPAHQTEHGFKFASRLEHPLDGSQQENFHSLASVLVLRSTEKMVQDVGYPFCSIPFQTVQIVPGGMIAALVKLSFYLREGRCQIVRVLWVESRTETVEAIPVDVALGSFRVDVLTVGKAETPVIVFGVIGAVGPGSSVVSC